MLARTLASAGDPGYVSTLQRLQHESGNRAIRNRAKHVITKIWFYQIRNEIMQDMSTHRPDQSLRSTRLLNLLNSEDLKMSRFAAEEIVRQAGAEPVVQDWLEQAVEAQVYNTTNKLQEDTVAWYCKALAASNLEKYRPLLEGIASNSSTPSKIRRHVKKTLRS